MERSAGILLRCSPCRGHTASAPWAGRPGPLPNFSTTPGRGGGRCCRWGPPERGTPPTPSESTFAGNPLLIDLEDLRDPRAC